MRDKHAYINQLTLEVKSKEVKHKGFVYRLKWSSEWGFGLEAKEDTFGEEWIDVELLGSKEEAAHVLGELLYFGIDEEA
jgi:hypothetical protein